MYLHVKTHHLSDVDPDDPVDPVDPVELDSYDSKALIRTSAATSENIYQLK